MKKLLLILYFTFCFFPAAFSQNPLVKHWDKRFGGTHGDLLTCFRQTTDGGYILGGFSFSDSSGDKTQPDWDTINPISSDYWIVKIDSLGYKQWDKDFGGTEYDELFALELTSDGGYILGGISNSPVSGDKTEANRDTSCTSFCTFDYWIVKIDSAGNKLWDKRFGGTADDILYSLQQTTDGGYILGGYSLSGTSGDKTEDSLGGADYWMVKTDSIGNKQWDKDFGGTDDDQMHSLQQTADGGYILGGWSISGSGGDKSQPTWGYYDYWIIKTDSLGTKQWDKDFGGTGGDIFSSLVQASDGGYVLGGISQSDTSGDKTQASRGGYDYWIIKTDSVGDKEWDRDFGGIEWEDSFESIVQTADGGYLMAGSSYSDSTGDKTENNLGPEQTWVVKTDSLGIKQWDKTLLTDTPGDDESGFAIQIKGNCYAMANWTTAGAGGDKTQASRGIEDYWIIKFCDTTTIVSTVSITELSSAESPFTIYPNPASDEFTISSGKAINKIEIYNLFGEKVFHKQLPTYALRLPSSVFPNGMYIVKAYADKGVFQRKLVIQ